VQAEPRTCAQQHEYGWHDQDGVSGDSGVHVVMLFEFMTKENTFIAFFDADPGR
jgi:hypothetical protein